jgi:hypothetical protein
MGGTQIKEVGGGGENNPNASNLSGQAYKQVSDFMTGANGNTSAPTAINRMINGQPTDPNNYQDFLRSARNVVGQPMSNPTPPTLPSGSTSPVGTNPNVPTNAPPPAQGTTQVGSNHTITEQAYLPNNNPANTTVINGQGMFDTMPQANPSSLVNPKPVPTQTVPAPNAQTGLVLPGSQGAQLQSVGGFDVNSPMATAAQAMIKNQHDLDLANLRARYGAAGGAAYGTGAMRDEAMLDSQYAPQLATALGNLNMQQANINLGQRGQDLQNFLGSTSLNNSAALGQGNLGANLLGINQQGQQNALQQMMGAIGQGVGLNTAPRQNIQQANPATETIGAISGLLTSLGNSGAAGGIVDWLKKLLGGGIGPGSNLPPIGDGGSGPVGTQQTPGGIEQPPGSGTGYGTPNPATMAPPQYPTTGGTEGGTEGQGPDQSPYSGGNADTLPPESIGAPFNLPPVNNGGGLSQDSGNNNTPPDNTSPGNVNGHLGPTGLSNPPISAIPMGNPQSGSDGPQPNTGPSQPPSLPPISTPNKPLTPQGTGNQGEEDPNKKINSNFDPSNPNTWFGSGSGGNDGGYANSQRNWWEGGY